MPEGVACKQNPICIAKLEHQSVDRDGEEKAHRFAIVRGWRKKTFHEEFIDAKSPFTAPDFGSSRPCVVIHQDFDQGVLRHRAKAGYHIERYIV
jgi:hypothetical protein